MVVLVDDNKAVEISIREWDEENSQYGPTGRPTSSRSARYRKYRI